MRPILKQLQCLAALLLVASGAWAAAASITLTPSCPSNAQPNSTVNYTYTLTNGTGSSIRYMHHQCQSHLLK